MSQESIEILKNYFAIPYGGHVFIFTNKITLEDIQQFSFSQILSHRNARDAQGLAGHSVALAIFEEITEHMKGLSGKKVLDVGGNTGYFSFLAAEAGAEATIIEKNTRQANVAKAIADVKGLNVKIVNDSIQNYLEASTETYDCALMLNMFDQMLRADEFSAWETLMQISQRSKTLYLMMGSTEQMPTVKGLPTSTPSNILPAKTVFQKPDYEVVMDKTVYKNYKVLATDIYENRQLQVYW